MKVKIPSDIFQIIYQYLFADVKQELLKKIPKDEACYTNQDKIDSVVDFCQEYYKNFEHDGMAHLAKELIICDSELFNTYVFGKIKTILNDQPRLILRINFFRPSIISADPILEIFFTKIINSEMQNYPIIYFK